MPVPRIAEVTCTSPNRVRDVIHNFDADGFDALYPGNRGGRPATFSTEQRQLGMSGVSCPTTFDVSVVSASPVERDRDQRRLRRPVDSPVSYTHLTLPTIYSV